MGNNRRRLGEVLVAAGVLTPGQLKTALAYQQNNGGRLAEVIITLGLASEQKLMYALSAQLGIPWKKVGDLKIPDAVLNLVPRPLIERHGVLPLQARSGTPWPKLLLAMSEPQNLKVIDEIKFASGHSIYPVLSSRQDLERAFRLNGIYGVKDLARQLELDEADPGEEFIVVRDGSIFA